MAIKMRLIKDYMRNDSLRHELNALTEKTFCFNFENWVTQGYFEGEYIPYSFEQNGKVISNVSANLMKFMQNGKIRNYIQIGTVMTDENYRNQGFARRLMEQILEDYKDKCDGIYLFANLSALEFYRKIGFKEKRQYLYIMKEDAKPARDFRHGDFKPVNSDEAEQKKRYMDYVRKSVPCGAFEQINKYGLQMFYTGGLDNVYYSETLDCFIVLETDDGVAELQSIISLKSISLPDVICQICAEYETLRLGFTPRKEDAHLFDSRVYDGGDDYRLFCLGDKLDSIEEEKLYFPALSHA